MKTIMLALFIASLAIAAIGQTTEYQRVRKMKVLADKQRAYLELSQKDRVRFWRENEAYVRMTEDLTPEQDGYITRSLIAFERGEMTEELSQEAKELFDNEQAERIFIPGPYTERGSLCVELTFKPRTPYAFGFASKKYADCDCNQLGTNWSCNSGCGPSNSCSPTQSGCSIWWAYPCNGKCYDSTRGAIMVRRREDEG